jgi:peptidoglycan/LPS O-acetylase OafA/YrhL
VFSSLQLGRGLAAIGVILFHSEDVGSMERYWGWSHHYLNFGASAVYFFFVLSGIVILHAHRRDIGMPSQLGSYTWKRFRRIYPIHWVVLLVLVGLFLLRPENFFDGRNIATILQSFLLVPLSPSALINPVAWTLEHEVLFYIMFVFLLLSRRAGTVVMGVWMTASLVALFVPPQNPSLAFFISPLHLLFGMGMMVAEAARSLSWRGTPIAFTGLVGLVACCGYVNVYRPAMDSFPIIFGVFSALTAFGFMLIEKKTSLTIPSLLIFLGDASYSIYLVHFSVILIAARLVYPLWERHPVPMIFPFAALVSLGLGVGIIVYRFVEVPLMRRIPRRLG